MDRTAENILVEKLLNLANTESGITEEIIRDAAGWIAHMADLQREMRSEYKDIKAERDAYKEKLDRIDRELDAPDENILFTIESILDN